MRFWRRAFWTLLCPPCQECPPQQDGPVDFDGAVRARVDAILPDIKRLAKESAEWRAGEKVRRLAQRVAALERATAEQDELLLTYVKTIRVLVERPDHAPPEGTET